MKNSNALKKIITIVFFLFCVSVLFYMCFHKEKIKILEAQAKERAIQNALKNGYKAQFIDEKSFFVNRDGLDYYFRVSGSNILFDMCSFTVEQSGINVEKGTITITIFYRDGDTVNVDYDDSRVIIQEDGEKQPMYSGSFFISDTEFNKDSLVINDYVPDGVQKSIDAYNRIMKYTTVEELKKHYNEALDICAELNS